MFPCIIHECCPVAGDLTEDIDFTRFVPFHTARPGIDQNLLFALTPEVIHQTVPEFFCKEILVCVLLDNIAKLPTKAAVLENVKGLDLSFITVIVKNVPLHGDLLAYKLEESVARDAEKHRIVSSLFFYT